MHSITFAYYSISSDYFVVVDILVEFIIAGIVHPTYFRVMPFKANIFELSNEKGLQSCDIFRLLLCFYLFYSIYKKIVIEVLLIIFRGIKDLSRILTQ